MNTRSASAALLLALGLSACGGAGAPDDGVASASGATGTKPSASPSASPSAGTDPQEAALKFARCMRQQGIDMADPKAEGGGIQLRRPEGVSEERLEKAHKVCAPILESAVGDRETPSPEDYDRLVKFAQCMRRHGIDMADPKPGEPMRLRIKGGSKEKMEAAQQACEQYQPGRGGKRTGGAP